MLEAVLITSSPGGVEIGTPAGGDEVDRGVIGHMSAPFGVEGLEQPHGVENLAGREAGREREGGEDLRGERTDMGERRFHHLQVAAVARQALIVAPCCSGETLRAEATHARADRCVIKVGVEDHAEDVIEEHQAGHVGLDQLRLTFGYLEPGPAVGAGQGLVEQAHHLVDDLGMGRSQGGQQDRIAPLGGHLAYRPRSGTPSEHGELAEPLGRDSAQVQTVSAKAA